MNIRIILAFSTMIGTTLGGFVDWQTEARASQSFSPYYIARETFTADAERDSYRSFRTRKSVKSSNPIQIAQTSSRSIFDLLNEKENSPQAKPRKRRNSAAAPHKNQLSRGAARRAELREYLTVEAARQADSKRKEPEVFELFKGDELKSKSRQDDSMAVTKLDADELKKRLAEKAARRAEMKKWLTAEIKLGERDARVPMIRAQMVELGFLSEDNSLAWMVGHPADQVSNPLDLELILDIELSKAIKAFQKGNGIKQTGRIDNATVAALNASEVAQNERKAQEEALALAKRRQAEDGERQRLAAEAAASQRQAEEAQRQRIAAEAAAKQRQAEEAERQRLAAEAAEKQRQAEEERKAQEAAIALAKQRQAEEERERQRLAAEAADKQRQAEEERKAQEAVLALAKQRQAEEERERQRLAAEAAEKQRHAKEAERQRLMAEAEEQRKAQEAALALEKQRQAEDAERQRLAAEAAMKQRQAEEERKAREALAKQQAEEARRLAHNRKVASLDSGMGANGALSESCNKARSIIGKWGFQNIEANSCEGKVYTFSATRKGKRFSVKINARTSELTEVKRVLSSAAE